MIEICGSKEVDRISIRNLDNYIGCLRGNLEKQLLKFNIRNQYFQFVSRSRISSLDFLQEQAIRFVDTVIIVSIFKGIIVLS